MNEATRKTAARLALIARGDLESAESAEAHEEATGAILNAAQTLCDAVESLAELRAIGDPFAASTLTFETSGAYSSFAETPEPEALTLAAWSEAEDGTLCPPETLTANLPEGAECIASARIPRRTGSAVCGVVLCHLEGNVVTPYVVWDVNPEGVFSGNYIYPGETPDATLYNAYIRFSKRLTDLSYFLS